VRARIAATVVLAGGILVGTSGCNLFAPQATTIAYDASDGVSATVGDIAIRNAILISTDGTNANLVATLVNRGDSARRVNVQYEADGRKVTDEVTVQRNSTVTLGTDDAPSVTLRDVSAEPGSLFPVFVQYGEETGADMLVPVLGNTLSEYSTLTPAPTQTPKPTASQAPTPAPTPTPTPTTAP
jgi:hypothetical protein